MPIPTLGGARPGLQDVCLAVAHPGPGGTRGHSQRHAAGRRGVRTPAPSSHGDGAWLPRAVLQEAGISGNRYNKWNRVLSSQGVLWRASGGAPSAPRSSRGGWRPPAPALTLAAFPWNPFFKGQAFPWENVGHLQSVGAKLSVKKPLRVASLTVLFFPFH